MEVAEWPKATVCKTVKPSVQIRPSTPSFCPGGVMVATLVLGTSAARRVGSSPTWGTNCTVLRSTDRISGYEPGDGGSIPSGPANVVFLQHCN